MDGMLGVLEVGGRDDHRVKPEAVLGLVERDVAPERLDLVTELRLHLGLRVLVEALLPEVRDCDHLEVKLLVVVQEARQERSAKAVRVADARDADLVVCACGVERGAVPGGDYAGKAGGTLAEFTTIDFFHQTIPFIVSIAVFAFFAKSFASPQPHSQLTPPV